MRAAVVRLDQSVESVPDCVAGAENAAEAEECILPLAEPKTASATSSATIKEADKRAVLLGADDSLQACISGAEGRSEIDECELDYQTLVQGPSSPSIYDEEGDSQGLNVGPVVLVAAVAVIAAFNLLPGLLPS